MTAELRDLLYVSRGAVAAGTPAGCAVGHDITGPPPSSHGHIPRRGQGARMGAREPSGRLCLHLGRAHCGGAGGWDTG